LIAYAAIAVGAVVALYSLHRLFLWMEDRGWVYYWHKSGSGNAGNILMPIQAIYQPEVKYVLDERARCEAEDEQDESGAPPHPADEIFNDTE
jgi:hypothetical protein